MTVKVQKAKVVINDDDQDSNSSASGSENDQESDVSQQGSDNLEYQQIDAESAEFFNEGWADSIAKVLHMNKPKKKKSLVLSKAKKLNEVNKTKKVVESTYEVAAEDGKVKKELIVKEDQETKEPVTKKKKKSDLPNLRVKPNVLEKDREKIFQKIATRGVVQLFNAVKMQQKNINKQLEEAGPLEVHKEKVLKNIDKRAFLDVLMGEKSTKVDDKIKDNGKKTSEWSVLRDDFMMSAKMKDWDKELEGEEEESEREMEVESD